MKFVDHTIVRLASPALRQTLFDDMALEQILAACYDTNTLPVNAPFNAEFNELECGLICQQTALGQGLGYIPKVTEPLKFNIELTDLPNSHATQAHAYWRGNIIARSAPDNSTITAVNLAWPNITQLDAEIIAADGALPSAPTELEARRRQRLMVNLQSIVGDPDTVTESMIDKLLTSSNVTTIAALLLSPTANTAGLAIEFSEPSGAAPSARRYPIVSGILIYESEFSIAEALFQSKQLLKKLERLGLDTQEKKLLSAKRSAVVIWLLPPETFDDTDWPGATAGMNTEQARSARRSQAGQWLANEGIGLGVVS